MVQEYILGSSPTFAEKGNRSKSTAARDNSGHVNGQDVKFWLAWFVHFTLRHSHTCGVHGVSARATGHRGEVLQSPGRGGWQDQETKESLDHAYAGQVWGEYSSKHTYSHIQVHGLVKDFWIVFFFLIIWFLPTSKQKQKTPKNNNIQNAFASQASMLGTDEVIWAKSESF